MANNRYNSAVVNEMYFEDAWDLLRMGLHKRSEETARQLYNAQADKINKPFNQFYRAEKLFNKKGSVEKQKKKALDIMKRLKTMGEAK